MLEETIEQMGLDLLFRITGLRVDAEISEEGCSILEQGRQEFVDFETPSLLPHKTTRGQKVGIGSMTGMKSSYCVFVILGSSQVW